MLPASCLASFLSTLHVPTAHVTRPPWFQIVIPGSGMQSWLIISFWSSIVFIWEVEITHTHTALLCCLTLHIPAVAALRSCDYYHSLTPVNGGSQLLEPSPLLSRTHPGGYDWSQAPEAERSWIPDTLRWDGNVLTSRKNATSLLFYF